MAGIRGSCRCGLVSEPNATSDVFSLCGIYSQALHNAWVASYQECLYVCSTGVGDDRELAFSPGELHGYIAFQLHAYGQGLR